MYKYSNDREFHLVSDKEDSAKLLNAIVLGDKVLES